MRFEAIEKGSVLLYSDADECIAWNVDVFDKTKFNSIDEVFKEINGYFAWLPVAKRQRLWELYSEIRHVLNNNTALDPLVQKLSTLVAGIYEIVTIDEMSYWLNVYGSVVYPQDMKEVNDPDDPSPDSTYLRKDYHGLVVMTAIFRCMVVVWGEFMSITHKTIGSDFKEYVALKLLSKSDIRYCEPMERLERYIVARVNRGNDTDPAVVDSLSTEEIPEWFLANVVIKRLAIGQINAVPGKGDIIKNIFGFVSSRLGNMANTFGPIKEKYPEEPAEGEEGNSILEMYRVKQSLTIGDVAMFNRYAQFPEQLVKHVDPNQPPAIDLGAYYEATNGLLNHQISRPQIILCQWVVPNALSPHAIPCLKKPELLRLMAGVQYLLTQWGLVDLAILVTSIGNLPEDADLGLADPRQRVPPELVETLKQMFPYTNPSEKETDRKSNYAYTAIMALTKEFAAYRWQINAPRHLIEQRTAAIDVARRYILPANLAEQLTRLVIQVDNLRG